MKYLILVAGFCLWLPACNSDNDSTVPPVREAGLYLDEKIEVSDQTRNYHLYLPEIRSNTTIVILLHGNGGSSDQLIVDKDAKAPFKVWLDIAQQQNIILAVPDGSEGSNNKQGWNDCRTDAATNPDTDDVLFIGNLMDVVQLSYSMGESDIFVTGISNGAMMAMRLADEIPEKIKAIATIAASRPVNSECADSTMPIPVLVMNGTSDPILPYEGGQIQSSRGEVYSAAETVSYWIARNQTDSAATVSVIADTDQDDESSVIRYSYTQGLNNSVVEHYEVTNGGHTEPSIAERYTNLFKLIVGNQNGDLEMATEVWDFFKSL